VDKYCQCLADRTPASVKNGWKFLQKHERNRTFLW
jgi:hypothetical protein